MKPLHIFAFLTIMPLSFLPCTAGAGDLVVMPATETSLESLLWHSRPVVVFADSPEDPQFQRQMQLLAEDPAALEERDVLVIADTDPGARSGPRQRLRPRGFSLVLVDKDGEVKMRQPRPLRVREITHAIDRWPLRRQEMLERRPSGR